MIHFVDDPVAMLVNFSRMPGHNVAYESVFEKQTTKAGIKIYNSQKASHYMGDH